MAGNVYCPKDHDSLKISNGKWYWWSRGTGSITALDYLIEIRDYSFAEPVEALTGITANLKPTLTMPKKGESKMLLLPEKNVDSDRVAEYLFGHGIDFSLIQECIARALSLRIANTTTLFLSAWMQEERRSMLLS